MRAELSTYVEMTYKHNAASALHQVIDRLALHVEYEKYENNVENFIDAHMLEMATIHLEFIKNNPFKPFSEITLRLLGDVSERLRLHTVLHSYDDETENVADTTALVDAESILN